MAPWSRHSTESSKCLVTKPTEPRANGNDHVGKRSSPFNEANVKIDDEWGTFDSDPKDCEGKS